MAEDEVVEADYLTANDIVLEPEPRGDVVVLR